MQATKFKIIGKYWILYLDTEQSKSDIKKIQQMICTLTGLKNIPELKCYSLCGLTPKEKIFLTDKLVGAAKVQLIIVIDNVRDLCDDINNQSEASALITQIQKWATLGHHIILTLHVTRGTEDAARGAIGTEAINRAETVSLVVKDGSKSIVTPVVTRGKPFQEFAFNVDDNGLPSLINDWIKTPAKAKGVIKQKLTAESIAEHDHQEILSKIFTNNGLPTALKRITFIERLKENFLAKGIDFGDSKAREFISYYLAKNLVTKSKAINGVTKIDVYRLVIH